MSIWAHNPLGKGKVKVIYKYIYISNLVVFKYAYTFWNYTLVPGDFTQLPERVISSFSFPSIPIWYLWFRLSVSFNYLLTCALWIFLNLQSNHKFAQQQWRKRQQTAVQFCSIWTIWSLAGFLKLWDTVEWHLKYNKCARPLSSAAVYCATNYYTIKRSVFPQFQCNKYI